ncbi:DUF5825 family protein [Phytohabitans sp. LJ34]|uniref:DUF5825 family protein n=1 Tax=Phytohabitans sp. LJ34 TaxID=3452217 RepID=UPI003F89F050
MTTATALALSRYRHSASDLSTLPELAQGPDHVWSEPAEVARRYFAEGTGRVVLHDEVDLSRGLEDPATGRALALIRELTSYAIVVDWRLHLGGHVELWRQLCHLYPPSAVLDPRGLEIHRGWSGRHFIGQCVYRRGPGFVQVRDRRFKGLEKIITIDETEHLEAIRLLLDCAETSTVPSQALADFVGEDLVLHVGDRALWLPYLIRRWPIPAMTV